MTGSSFMLVDEILEFADANPMVALALAAGSILVIGLLLKRFFRPDGPSDRARSSEKAARFGIFGGKSGDSVSEPSGRHRD